MFISSTCQCLSTGWHQMLQLHACTCQDVTSCEDNLESLSHQYQRTVQLLTELWQTHHSWSINMLLLWMKYEWNNFMNFACPDDCDIYTNHNVITDYLISLLLLLSTGEFPTVCRYWRLNCSWKVWLSLTKCIMKHWDLLS